MGGLFLAGKFREVNCDECSPNIKERCLKGEKIEWNTSFEIDGEEIAGCPRSFLDPTWHPVFDVYRACRTVTDKGPQPNGILPVRGGALDQPNYLIEAFGLLDQVMLECRPKK